MEAVGQDRDRPREVPEGDLGDGDEEVEDENAPKDVDDRLMALGQFKIQNAKCKRCSTICTLNFAF
jgi:hypothetical protein